MKVLFAVSTENIAERIIKTYQKEYKEIISSKNVYYFNAIIKELQRNQSYDRIVISEDLEPFTNNNYEAIDKFIFEKLDGISDEAINGQGRDIPIVVICSERREKADNLLVKLFSIGIYDALVGNDRTIEEVCNLLNKPRTKKEAKSYYKIEQGEYDSNDEKNVSEIEIQNILSHYRKLGKNEERYVESFDSIAEQYNDEQLKIIIKFLPMEVKAVLEADSPKYQSIMTYKPATLKKEEKKSNLSVSKIADSHSKKLSGPVIIPSTVQTTNVRKISEEDVAQSNEQTKKVVQAPERRVQERREQERRVQERRAEVFEELESINTLDEIEKIDEVKESEDNQYSTNAMFEELENIEGVQPITPIEPIEPMEVKVEQAPKRGRGRPKKVLTEEERLAKEAKENAPKRGRGRPRKNPVDEEVNDIEEKEQALPMIEEPELPSFEEKEEFVTEVPSFKEESFGNELPGFEDNDEEEEQELPEFEEEDEELLPGFEDDDEGVEELLPGFEDDDEGVEEPLPGFEDDDEEVEEPLPGFEDDDEGVEEPLPGFEDDDEGVEESLPGFEDEDEDIEETLPEFEDDEEDEDEMEVEGLNNARQIHMGMQGFENKIQDTMKLNKELKNVEVEEKAVDISYLLTQDKKMVAFVGTSKNGVSFLVNNVAEILSNRGIKTAIVDLTRNKNSYYIYTENNENLREVAYSSMENLKQGKPIGIEVNRNLTVYTSSPNIRNTHYSIESMLTTLAKNYSLVLLDCDYSTNKEYFRAAQEIYLVQSMDVLTIQPLTEFLRRLKLKEVLKPEKLRAVINKAWKVKNLNEEMIVGGMSTYNDPEMSIQDRLFDMKNIKTTVIPFDIDAYSLYLSGMANCSISTKGYNKTFLSYLNKLAGQVYPEISTGNYNKKSTKNYNNYQPEGTKFSQNMNNTLNQMKKQYK